jgi:hypothetical protein
MKTLTKQNEQHVPSKHFVRHPDFAIGPEAQTVSGWHTAVTLAVSELEQRPVESFDCPLYRFAADEDGQLQLVIERRITKPRTLVSGFKARQRGNNNVPSDETMLDDAFDLISDSDGFQLPEPVLKAMLEAWTNRNRARVDGYQLLQCARAFSTLIAARHGCRLGVEDL